ncbi:MAG: YncE family protein [Pseudomonadota bacterium]|nr:YncE family protein [Pseudomonadota bacterium]
MIPRTGLRLFLFSTCIILGVRLSHGESLNTDQTALLRKYFDGPAYVTLQNANAVEVLPQKKMIRGLKSAHYDAVSPNGKILVVGSYTTGNVYIVDTRTDKIKATIPTGGTSVQGVVVTPDNRLALAADPDHGWVNVFDLHDFRLIHRIKVGPVPHNIGFSGNNGLAYVTLQGGTGVAIINLHSFRKTGEIPVPGIFGPHNLDFSDSGKIMWVRDVTGHVAAIDMATKKELAVIQVGHGHAGIDVLPGGRDIVTGAIADKIVDVIDATTMKVIRKIVVGQGPHGVRASRDGHWIYADNTVSNDVVVISAQTFRIAAKIPTRGANAFWIAVPWHP